MHFELINADWLSRKKNQNVNVYNMPHTFCIQVIAGEATDTAYIALDQVKVMRTDCPNIGI